MPSIGLHRFLCVFGTHTDKQAHTHKTFLKKVNKSSSANWKIIVQNIDHAASLDCARSSVAKLKQLIIGRIVLSVFYMVGKHWVRSLVISDCREQS